jgi:glutamine synthetase
MLASGLKGIEQRMEPPLPVEKDIYKMSSEERKNLNIDCLPGSLAEAIAELEKSELCKEVLGDHIFESLVANKKAEWDNYRTHVSQYELDKYLPIL